MFVAHACGSDVDTKTRDQRVLLSGTGTTNILVDSRVGATPTQANEFASLLQSSDALLHGVLCAQPLDGIRFTLRQYQKVEEDLEVQDLEDTSSAAAGGMVSEADREQLSVAVDRAVRAACISAGPCLLEPVYEAEVMCGSEDDVVGVYSALSVRGGTITTERQHATSPAYYVRGVVPVARSFGLVGAMDAETAGSAVVQCSYRGGWQRVTRSDPETAASAFMRCKYTGNPHCILIT